jgi:hypothetical protein
MFIGEVAEVLTWTIEPVSLSNHRVIFAKPFVSEDVTFAVKLALIVEALLGVGDTKSRVGDVVSTVNVLRVVFTFPEISVLDTFT